MSAIFSVILDFILDILTAAWFWIAIGVLVAFLLLRALYRKLKTWALGYLFYSRSFSTDGVFVGESLELIERIENHSWFPLFSVQIEFFVPAGITVDELVCREYTKVTSFCFVPPFSTVHKKHTIVANKRDHYKLNTASAVYRSNEFIFSDQLDFYAYPSCDGADLKLTTDLYHAGNAISDRKYIEDPFFISGIRPYRAGDPMRSINFKASLRSFSGGMRQLVTNNYDSSRNYDSMILLDLTTYAENSLRAEYQLELGLKYTCFLFCEALKNAGRVGFASNCAIGESRYVHIPCSSGEAHTKTMLESFSELAWFARRDFSMTAIVKAIAPTLSIGTDLYLVTPYVDGELAKLLSELERAELSVNVITLREGAEL